MENWPIYLKNLTLDLMQVPKCQIVEDWIYLMIQVPKCQRHHNGEGSDRQGHRVPSATPLLQSTENNDYDQMIRIIWI